MEKQKPRVNEKDKKVKTPPLAVDSLPLQDIKKLLNGRFTIQQIEDYFNEKYPEEHKKHSEFGYNKYQKITNPNSNDLPLSEQKDWFELLLKDKPQELAEVLEMISNAMVLEENS